MPDKPLTSDQMRKVIEEEVPVIATLIGDETKKVEMTIDEIINKTISQQAETSMSLVKDEMMSLQKMIVVPPYDPLKLALMLEINTRLMRACHLRARNTVGLGWGIRKVLTDEDEDDIDDKKYKAQKKRLKKLYTNPNPREVSLMLPETLATPLDFAEIMNRMKIDEEATGNGYLEITRNNAGQIDGIYNIPSHTIRVLRHGGYIQVRGRWSGSDVALQSDVKIRRRYFKRFGDMRPISRITGQGQANIPPEERATELLPFNIYSSRSSWYGIPRWISAVAAIQGSRLAAIRNMAFFENDAVGRMAIVVSGGALTGQSVQDLRTFVNREGKGVEKAHRVMVLQAEPRKVITNKGVGTKVDIIPLTVGIDEDASFLGYRAANDEEVREASGLSAPFFTATGVNRACLVGGTRIPMLDGSVKTIEDLASSHTDDTFWLYSCDGQKIVPGLAHSPQKMRTDVPVVDVLLDNGETVTATSDHLFMLRDGSYKEAEKLGFGDRLMPFRHKIPTTGYNKGHRFYKKLAGEWETLGASRSRINRVLRDNELTYKMLRNDNHRVVRVSRAGRADVYDLTVDDHHNFAVMAGVFVHNSANVLRKITIEQDLIPDLTSHEHVLNRTISYDYLTSQMSDRDKARFNMAAELKFKEPASVDELEQAQIQGQYARTGIVTINEARRFLGLEALPADLVYGQLPLPMALAYFEGGLFKQGAITDEGVESYDDTQKRMLDEMKKAADVAEGAKAKASIKIDAARAKNNVDAADGEQETEEAVVGAVAAVTGEADAGQAAEGTTPAKARAPEKWHSKKYIGKLREMSGVAWKLKQYLKSQGREIVSGELILQGRDGEVYDRVDLDDLEEGFDE